MDGDTLELVDLDFLMLLDIGEDWPVFYEWDVEDITKGPTHKICKMDCLILLHVRSMLRI